MVEFVPAHSHPFSVAEAASLDVSTIVSEINRLRNSLDHLLASQAQLKSFLDEEDDPDLRAAWNENDGVIASQTERVTLLRHVLASKVGEDSLAHYGIGDSADGARTDDNGAHSDARGPHTGDDGLGAHTGDDRGTYTDDRSANRDSVQSSATVPAPAPRGDEAADEGLYL